MSFVIFLPNFDEFFSDFRRQSQKMIEFVDKNHRMFGEREREDERSNLTASTAVHEEHRREEGCAEALENE